MKRFVKRLFSGRFILNAFYVCRINRSNPTASVMEYHRLQIQVNNKCKITYVRQTFADTLRSYHFYRSRIIIVFITTECTNLDRVNETTVVYRHERDAA